MSDPSTDSTDSADARADVLADLLGDLLDALRRGRSADNPELLEELDAIAARLRKVTRS